QEPGDFNIDIHISELLIGLNTVLIRAVDPFGMESLRSVTVEFDDANVWPLPYTIDWSESTPIQDVAQVADGRWGVEGNTVRPLELGYDRLLAIGDIEWQDYEVTCPITFLGLDERGFEWPSNRPGIGFLLRWPGHQVDGKQPHWTFQPLGAIGWYTFTSLTTGHLQILGNSLGQSNKTKSLSYGTTYM